MDGWPDGRVIAYMHYSIYAVARKNQTFDEHNQSTILSNTTFSIPSDPRKSIKSWEIVASRTYQFCRELQTYSKTRFRSWGHGEELCMSASSGLQVWSARTTTQQQYCVYIKITLGMIFKHSITLHSPVRSYSGWLYVNGFITKTKEKQFNAIEDIKWIVKYCKNKTKNSKTYTHKK